MADVVSTIGPLITLVRTGRFDLLRRLSYVACTRAREQLYVTHPLRYYTQPWAKADRHGYAQRSRFLTAAVLAHFEQIQTGPDPAEGDERPLGRVTTASIRAGVRSLWEAPAGA